MRKFLLGVVLLVAVALVGGYLALSRPDVPYADLDKAYATPASKFIDMGGGVAAHYRDEGNPNGRVLLLVHGFSASTQTWDKWIAALGSEYRMVSLDLPGHGLTVTPAGYQPTIEGFADYVDAVAEKLKLGKVTVIGSSMGGGTAWQLALRHPARIDALVLVDASGWAPPPKAGDNGPKIFGLMRNPVIGPFLRRLDNTSMVRQGLQSAFYDPKLADEAMVKRYVDMSRAPNHGEVLLTLMSGRGERTVATKELLAKIAAPTLILWGRQDNLVAVESATKFNDAIPGSKLIIYDKVGHLPQEEIPVRSASDLRNFLHAAFPETPTGAPLAAALPRK